MRAFVGAILAAVAMASAADFPADDSMHADCHLTATFPSMSCDSLYALVDAEIRAWDTPETSPAEGTYEMYQEQVDVYVWSTRLTRDQQYTDDQLFEFNQMSDGC